VAHFEPGENQKVFDSRISRIHDRQFDLAPRHTHALPGIKRECQFRFLCSSFRWDPHGAMKKDSSAELLQWVTHVESLGAGALCRKLDVDKRVDIGREQRLTVGSHHQHRGPTARRGIEGAD
jgi:hypothetical protein